MQAIQASGHQVIAIGTQDGFETKIEQAGIRHLAIKVSADSINPFREMVLLMQLFKLLRRERIDLVLSNTPKGNIYTGLVALVSRCSTVPNISGLGRVFIKPSFLTHVVKLLYRVSLHCAPYVFFQNKDDLRFFSRAQLVTSSKAILVPGSGVDLTRFRPKPKPTQFGDEPNYVNFLLLARLLWDKGIGEYVDAARCLKKRHEHVRFLLLGKLNAANPAAIPRAMIDRWQAEDLVEYLGHTDDVRPHIEAADCVVLPSYREGTPRSLLEAAASGKPIVTTNSIGCRDTVEDGITGFLCEPKSATDLADKMEKILLMTDSQRQAMGLEGRAKMEREFDEHIVINRYLTVIEEIAESTRMSSV